MPVNGRGRLGSNQLFLVAGYILIRMTIFHRASSPKLGGPYRTRTDQAKILQGFSGCPAHGPNSISPHRLSSCILVIMLFPIWHHLIEWRQNRSLNTSSVIIFYITWLAFKSSILFYCVSRRLIHDNSGFTRTDQRGSMAVGIDSSLANSLVIILVGAIGFEPIHPKKPGYSRLPLSNSTGRPKFYIFKNSL